MLDGVPEGLLLDAYKRCLWKGLSAGFIIAGIVLGIMGITLYNWLSEVANKLDVVLAITSNPEYLRFIDRLAEAMNDGRDLVISKEEASILYPLTSSIRTQILMINVEKGGAISNLLMLAGIIMVGTGIGWIAGFSLAKKRSGRSGSI